MTDYLIIDMRLRLGKSLALAAFMLGLTVSALGIEIATADDFASDVGVLAALAVNAIVWIVWAGRLIHSRRQLDIVQRKRDRIENLIS